MGADPLFTCSRVVRTSTRSRMDALRSSAQASPAYRRRPIASTTGSRSLSLKRKRSARFSRVSALCQRSAVLLTFLTYSQGVGGVWARENSTSQLQLNSILYRFHPSIEWSRAFPKRDEIIEQTKRVWEKYELQKQTRFSVRTPSFVRRCVRKNS